MFTGIMVEASCRYPSASVPAAGFLCADWTRASPAGRTCDGVLASARLGTFGLESPPRARMSAPTDMMGPLLGGSPLVRSWRNPAAVSGLMAEVHCLIKHTGVAAGRHIGLMRRVPRLPDFVRQRSNWSSNSTEVVLGLRVRGLGGARPTALGGALRWTN